MYAAAVDLWAKADLSGGVNACWPWLGNRNDSGYGRIYFGSRNEYAHRAAFRLAQGPIPDGLLVCHTCDNPPCVNPAHLFLGSIADNNGDRARKGRTARVGVIPIGPTTLDDLRSGRLTVARAAAMVGCSVRSVYRALERAA